MFPNFKKLIIKSALFLPIFLFVSDYSFQLSVDDQGQPNLVSPASNSSADLIFASLPPKQNDIITNVKTADARPEILRQYLAKYKSPLEPEAELIVQMADTYDFDYRWLVAIAQQESNLCKKIPENSYNCWGWGIYPEPNDPQTLRVTRFESYEDAVRSIAPQFKDHFLGDNHSKDAFKVMKTYTPPSDGSWANGINQFFDDLQ